MGRNSLAIEALQASLAYGHSEAIRLMEIIKAHQDDLATVTWARFDLQKLNNRMKSQHEELERLESSQ